MHAMLDQFGGLQPARDRTEHLLFGRSLARATFFHRLLAPVQLLLGNSKLQAFGSDHLGLLFFGALAQFHQTLQMVAFLFHRPTNSSSTDHATFAAQSFSALFVRPP